MTETATRRRLWAISLAGALATGCVSVTSVRGPDGEPAHLIKCNNSSDCTVKADEVCPDGYVRRSSGSSVYGSVVNGTGSVSSVTELTVTCKADMPIAEPALAELVARDMARACGNAFAQAEAFGKYWVVISPGATPLEEPPQKGDFVAACIKMPPNVQRCMSERYRVEHVKACDAALLRLDTDSRARIDALFLEAPRSTTPAPITTAVPF